VFCCKQFERILCPDRRARLLHEWRVISVLDDAKPAKDDWTLGGTCHGSGFYRVTGQDLRRKQ